MTLAGAGSPTIVLRKRKQLEGAGIQIKGVEMVADEERQALAKVAQRMLGVDIAPALKNASPEDVEAITRQWKKLKEGDPNGIVQHFRQTAEIQKYCSVWEVHINEDGTVRLRFGDAPSIVQPSNADAFAQQVYDKSKEAGEPKGLVLFLETFGDAQLSTRNSVKKGLKIAADLLTAHWPGKRFEIAIPHFSAKPPP